ncbi:isocitrate/isopropylmalate dehydrogenase family protein [Burkholderia sp. 22PA0106]|uniref:isocitrate/isopropylmalate dehydrogenase family protein n=1 Tax=Burkholderia sp. 22PA0106 TaxID=3237371 RepID=UPI0039C132AD
MKLAVLPGDDIGPEIMDATLAVVREADKKFGLDLSLEIHEVGMSLHRKRGTTLPPEVVEAARAADGVLLGPGGMTLYPPAGEGGINIPGTIRKQLDLFANIRPARSRPGVPMAHPGLDCVIVRENTEGFYADRNMFKGYGEFMPTPDSAIALRLITAKASRRIAETAFKVAMTRRKHVTVVGKRHVMQVTDGLFMSEVDKVAAQYPEVKLREIDVDAIAAELYTKPGAFDVILTTNMFGDILSNLVNALAGGLGMASALNVGEEHAAANAGHGSAPDIAGKGIANPIGLILSAAALLTHLGLRPGAQAYGKAGQAIERAVDAALAHAESRTGDLGGTAGTQAVTAAICGYIRDQQ